MSDVPDFERDDAAAAAYEAAKQRYIRAVVEQSEAALHEAFVKRRSELSEEVDSLTAVVKTRQETFETAAAAYAVRLPHRVKKTVVRPPSFFERLRTFNAIGRFYRRAADAANLLDDAQAMLRKRRDAIDTLERETKRTIYLREEAVRKRLQTPEGLAELHNSPLVRGAYARLQAAQADRAAFDERVKRGEVTPEEARDREMQQRGQTFATVPLSGVIIARIVQYASLTYYVLRDVARKEMLLSYDPALEPLRDLVFEVTHTSAGYDAQLHYLADGAPRRVLDHLKATFGAAQVEDLYAAHREGLRAPSPAAPTAPRDAAEAELIGILKLLANAVRQAHIGDDALVDA